MDRRLPLLAALLAAPLLLAAGRAAPPPPTATADSCSWDLLAYNTWLRPRSLFPNRQLQRAGALGAVLGGHDVLVLSELFDDRSREVLLAGLREAYPYRTELVGEDRGALQDGGVMILSRWPVVAQGQQLYGVCSGSDCFAAKGLAYARIERPGCVVHVLGTHAQAGPATAVRREQLRQLRRFVDALQVPADEPLLIAGDLNVNGVGAEWERALRTLRAAAPPSAAGPWATFDPVRNRNAHGERSLRLDHALYSLGHQLPLRAQQRTRMIEAHGQPLSDHYAVEGTFEFP